jgi:hypothetical protein
MTTWAKVNQKLDLFLDDAEREGTAQLFPIALRVEAWNWAQRVLCHHTPRQQAMDLVIDKGKRAAVLPSDFFAIHGVFDAGREVWWHPIIFKPGDVRYADDDLPEYWVWGNQMFLEDEIAYSATDYTFYYWAYWPEVEYDSAAEVYEQEQIYIPRWAELALAHLTTATCMMPLEIFSSDINQYKIRIESGTPLDNPRAQSADFHLAWYRTLLDLYPPARDVSAGPWH